MGDGLAYLIIGFATAFNILVIKFKIERKRYADGIFDAICLMLLAGVFAGTLGGLIIGTIASAVISVSLFFFDDCPICCCHDYTSSSLDTL